MSQCPHCGTYDGGDHRGRKVPNHFCTVEQSLPPTYVVLNADQLAAAKELDEQCRGIIERLNSDLREAEERKVANAIAEERRQERMRTEQKRLLEELQREAEKKKFCLEYGFDS